MVHIKIKKKEMMPLISGERIDWDNSNKSTFYLNKELRPFTKNKLRLNTECVKEKNNFKDFLPPISRLNATQFQNLNKATVIKTAWYLRKDRYINGETRNRTS